MNYKKWMLREQDKEAEAILVQNHIPVLSAKVLAARGIKTVAQAKEAIRTGIELINDPSIMADMGKACDRIKKSLTEGEKIAVYGDYDVDGITAVCLIVSWLREKGADCVYYIPDRIEEGYGVNTAAIKQLEHDGVRLIITVDLGITAIDEVKYAASLGVDMIITDHHECHEKLPEAFAVINPMRTDCAYPFKTLSGVGVAFMLALAYEGMAEIDRMLEKFSDLVAIGTVADVMPLIGVNRALTARGIDEINRGRRIGLKALAKESVPEDAKVNTGFIGFSIAPRINAAGRMGCASIASELFLTTSVKQAQELTEKLCELNRMRQKTENDTFEDAVAVSERYIRENSGRKIGALVLSDDGWHQGVLGIVASRLSERFACPVFLISLEKGVGKGSARSFYGINILSAMQKASDLFETWGGHEYAAGFMIKEENIPALRDLLENMTCELGRPHIHIDAEIGIDMLTEKMVSGLDILEPYGSHNPVPAFKIKHVTIQEIITLGWGNSLRLTIIKDNIPFSAFYFGMNMNRLDMCEGDTGDAVCKVEVGESKGKKAVRIVLYDLKPEPEDFERYQQETSLYARFAAGEEITREEALTLMPQKQDFIALLRHIKRNCNQESKMAARIGALCRRICREEHLQKTYARLLVCIEILAEKNRLHYKIEEDAIEIEMLEEKPTNLNNANMMIRLRGILDGSNE